MPVPPKLIVMRLAKTARFGVLPALLFLLTASTCEDSECNYITDYYQLVYDAQLEYLKENYDSAYALLEQAKSKCGLLNQPETRETVMYAALCARKGLYDEAFYQLEQALKAGFPFKALEYYEGLESLYDDPRWAALKAKAPEYKAAFENSINAALRAEIIAMNKADQKVRNPPDYVQMKITDSLNETRMKVIFTTYGYPNEQRIGMNVPLENTDITAMLMHFKDTAYFKPLLYACIKKGECPPDALGSMIDSQERGTGAFTYGIYDNADSTEIKDFKHLDKRRTAIGLRPWKKHKETMRLIVAKYEPD